METHDEPTFRYLLALEQRRSDRSGRPFALVLVQATESRSGGARLDPDVAASIFTSLASELRETDFLGWYEDGRCAGAVLTELGDGAHQDIGALLRDKVMARGLLNHLLRGVSPQLRIEVVRYPALEA